MVPLAYIAMTVPFVSSATLYASDNDKDAKIESTFKNTSVYKNLLIEDSVRANAKNGVVTLTGNVHTDNVKDLTEEAVLNIPGVTSVNNKLKIESDGSVKSSDAWISKKVKMSLMFHRHIESGKVDVLVNDGVVTLRGDASGLAQRDLITEYAKDIDGVKEVKNEMTVLEKIVTEKQTFGEKLDDSSITAQVKLSLLTHRSTSAIHTKVTTMEGVVTLTGVAKSSAEKTLVTKLVTDIRGVNNVINNMTVSDK